VVHSQEEGQQASVDHFGAHLQPLLHMRFLGTISAAHNRVFNIVMSNG
jgi:hypothetical protein